MRPERSEANVGGRQRASGSCEHGARAYFRRSMTSSSPAAAVAVSTFGGDFGSA
jgi:hypothetical protein